MRSPGLIPATIPSVSFTLMEADFAATCRPIAVAILISKRFPWSAKKPRCDQGELV
jgi:hypothetical protein